MNAVNRESPELPRTVSPEEVLNVDFQLPSRYTFRKTLGQGGMGTVLEVDDRALGRRVALKVLTRASNLSRQRFLAEYAAMGMLEHPAIVPCYTVDEDASERLYLTMMKVAGRTLYEGMAGVGPLPREKLLWALATAARAVGHAHRRGIVHRDIKPENIMLGEHGEVWVLDWGIVRTRNAERGTRKCEDEEQDEDAESAQGLTRAGGVLGTPGYLAPEQLGGRAGDVGPAADIHGLGAILYEILTGKRPYTGLNVAELACSMAGGPPVRPSGKGIPPELAAVAMKALERDPAARYPAAELFAADIENYLAGRPVSVHRESTTVKMVRSVRRHSVAWAAVPVVILIVAAAGGLAWASRRIEDGTARARERVVLQDEADRVNRAADGLERAMADADAAHRARMAALAIHAEPLDRVYEGDVPAPGRAAVFQPSSDSEIERANREWSAAIARALAHVEVARDRESSRVILTQKLAWGLEVARLEERSEISLAQVERCRANESASWRKAAKVAAELGESPGLLDPAGRLRLGRLGADVSRARLVEYLPAGGQRDLAPIVEEGGEWPLPLGSYAAVVERGPDAFVFPVLVERGELAVLDLAIPRSVPAGMVWVPGGEFLAGGEGTGAWPRHRRRIAAGFFVARTETTLEEYREFLRALPPARRADLWPVIPAEETVAYFDERLEITEEARRLWDVTLRFAVAGVAREAAAEFARWKSSGDGAFEYALASDAEWERAARGADGRMFVWGEGWAADRARVAVKCDGEVAAHAGDSSVFGVLDLTGNLAEWSRSDAQENAIVRGGFWASDEFEARAGSRDPSVDPSQRHLRVGIRLVARPR